jgi:hypothetical protein
VLVFARLEQSAKANNSLVHVFLTEMKMVLFQTAIKEMSGILCGRRSFLFSVIGIS